MNIKRLIIGSLAGLAGLASGTQAQVTPDEAKQLGSTLTQLGAVKAGNKEGTIPAYTGGLQKAPAGFKAGSGVWADPFKDEAPVLRIDARNYQQHADKLSDGQKELFKKHSGFYMDVYPTHRTAAVPERVLAKTVRNATSCKTAKGGLAVDQACRGGIPFPIAKTGNEMMWNQQLRYKADTTTRSSRSWVVDASGKAVMTSQQQTFEETPYYHEDLDGRDEQMYWRTYSVTSAPIRKAGEVTGLMDFLDPTQKPRRAWSYAPGQRRIKLAPEFSYDTPVASMGGVTLFDELFVFSGQMDRFDFKLVGKKEMYVPYNAYKLYFGCGVEEQFKEKYPNPACWRWELHRMWVVEATLKQGFRHAYAKRTYYIDEDSYGAMLYDAYDRSGQLYRSIFNSMIQLYDVDAPYTVKNVIFDFNKGMYALVNDGLVGGYAVVTKPRSNRDLNPETIVAKETAR
ncbi:hypothetical protein ABIB42_004443 [Massilia sp. UYP32]|uniref:DUF1329 domain-containing protein n=1 Tax=Massilia sp. UYP32 TaxID=1756386 RepID=UPI003D1D0165